MELAARRSCSISARCLGCRCFAELNNNNITHPQRQEAALRRRDRKEEAVVPHGKGRDLYSPGDRDRVVALPAAPSSTVPYR